MQPERPTDAAERARALDVAHSFIVQAPAGSGKTELLTRRLLALLAEVEEPESIVALTFTRKAAAEMRHRVLAALERAADPAPPADDYQRATWELARRARAHAEECGWQLEQSPLRLRVMTLDALCVSLVQRNPIAAAFGAGAAIVDDAKALYREAAHATLGLLDGEPLFAAPVARVLRHFDNDTRALERQIGDLLERRDQWLDLVQSPGRLNLERLEDALGELVGESLAALGALISVQQVQRWLSLARYAVDNLRPEHPEHALCAAGELERIGFGIDALPQWQALIELLLTGNDGWRARLTRDEGFPPGSGKVEKEAARLRKEEVFALIEELSASPGLLELLAHIRRLPPPRYSEAQLAIARDLLTVASFAEVQLRAVFAARGLADFVEVGRQALAALGVEQAPSELAERLDRKLRHLLVDEFQDTSEQQLRLLRQLVEGWQDGDGRSLFLVGDPMQSIYRFRKAEVGLFLEVQRDGLGSVKPTPLKLSSNFRSQPAIVDWINAAFRGVMPARDDIGRGAVSYAPALAARPQGTGAVALHLTFDGEPAEEARAIAQLVAQARAHEPDESIAVLVRSRSHLAEILPALQDAGVIYQAVEIEALGGRQAIEDLLSLARALTQPADRLSWLASLRAPWCGLRLADLQTLVDALAENAPLLSALRDESARVRLSADVQARLARALPPIEAALSDCGRKPLARCVEDLWLALGGPACLRDEAELADARALLGVLEQIDFHDRFALERALENLKAAPDPRADGRVQVMTVHKAKGLEFDRVILPGLARRPPLPDRNALALTTRANQHGDVRLLLATLHARGAERDPLYDLVSGLEREKQEFEMGRLLYVAATRARKHLHLFADAPLSWKTGVPELRTPASGSLAAQLWPSLRAGFEARLAEAAPRPPAKTQIATAREAPKLRRLPADWTPPPAPEGPAPVAAPAISSTESAVIFDWAGERARLIGTLVHRWAQHIAEAGGAERWSARQLDSAMPAVEAELQAAGLDAGEREAAAARVREALANFLDDDRGRWLLHAHRESRSELKLAAVERGALRQWIVDRTFVDDGGTRWIVDYKTGVHEGGAVEQFLDREQERYRPQLENYARLFRAVDPRPVRLGLYFPLLKGWREWSPSP